MTEHQLRIMRSALSAIRAIKDNVERIAEQHGSHGNHENPPPQVYVNSEVSIPPAIADYYKAENDERPKNKRRDRIKVVLEVFTFAAALVAAVFTGLTWQQIKTQTASIKKSADAAADAATAAISAAWFQSTRSQPTDIPAIYVRNIQQRNGHLYIWGWARYRDVFPTTPWHTTKFCTEITDVIGDLRASSIQILTANRERGNCYDEECK